MRLPTSQEQLRHELEFGPLTNNSSPNLSPPPEITRSLSLNQRKTTNMEVDPDSDSPLARFLAAPTSPLPPDTPSKPRAMREYEGSAASGSVSSRPRKIDVSKPRLKERSLSPTPAAKKRKFESTWKTDHYSPPPARSRPERELFPVRKYEARDKERTSSRRKEVRSRSSSTFPEKDEYAVKPSENHKDEAPKVKYPTLKSIVIPQGDDAICYNCGAKGHWFMDCLAGCGRCGGEGHKTYLCDHLGKGKLIKKEDMEE